MKLLNSQWSIVKVLPPLFDIPGAFAIESNLMFVKFTSDFVFMQNPLLTFNLIVTLSSPEMSTVLLTVSVESMV